LVVNEHGKGVFRMQGSAATPDAEALATAAPDMARALLVDMVTLESGAAHDHGCTGLESADFSCTGRCVRKVAALRKAGVLP